MDINVQKNQMHNHQQTAQKLLDLSPVLKQLFQDQWFYLWSLTPENLFVIDENEKELKVADGLLTVHFKENEEELIEFSTSYSNVDMQRIADFVFNDISFLIADLKSQHSLFLQTKVQIFRQLLAEEIFYWVDGENRVEQFLYNLTPYEAELVDQLMIENGYYTEFHLKEFAQSGIDVPLSVELNFKHLSLVNSLLGDDFLPTQKIIPFYDQLCFSAHQFIPKNIYRILQTLMDDRFCLADIVKHRIDFGLLLQHANENAHLLSLTRLIKKQYWQFNDIFSKQNFLNADCIYWEDYLRQGFPICHFKRTVNWLYRQDSMVIDWIAQHIEDANVRVTMTALSFLDTTHVDAQIIECTLKYFKSTAARLFINECSQFAARKKWFQPQEQIAQYVTSSKMDHPYALLTEQQPSSHQKGIRASVLYIEEWFDLLNKMSRGDAYIVKKVFKNLNRVIQAYMLFLKDLLQDVPPALIAYIEPETQQNPFFFQTLQQYQMDVDHFRQKFKHQRFHLNRSISIFDSYVADYLIEVFNQHREIPKNVTWTGLYQQAVKWHQKIHFEDTLVKLRQKINVDSWRRVSPQKVMFTERWRFMELNSLEQIIHESVKYKHCLALSYTEIIAAGQYVAFHMSSLENEAVHLTLGCFYRFDQLYFDQLRLPNNEEASKEMVRDAQAFVKEVNQYLIWDFKEPKIE